ncbi:NAD(P)H-binding protein [Conexibacter sp. JD483]|uniref:NAD(P)H-binding protein n=1 Tax=unclassified Conexibacter TaxID=2627773 RepID=UPI0027251144|nr:MULTISPECIES: NAD(P)H-binding protein [unclassified Conexibacter]MDO8185360.1 NAD(P)H-binding protein [Conexibacter sp. CPCC 205706]MDO8198464.1 NAD(P)H-binding protein [Conexibacter sp. CPCC 205762]MDR9368771.1 NAD(P)H-binding protein [Conexibacter sp. JD483]
MEVFVIGLTGKVGDLLAQELLARGDRVRGLVRREQQRAALAARGIDAVVGDLAAIGADALATAIGGADAIVFAAGSNGGSAAVTKAIDEDGVATAIEAARRAGGQPPRPASAPASSQPAQPASPPAGSPRLALVSVLPESWRERDNGDEVEFYFAAKKRAEVALTRSVLDWLILRPSLLVDDPPTGTVALGPAELHDQIPRADVAATLAALLHEPRISRQILELNCGSTPIPAAVAANVRG